MSMARHRKRRAAAEFQHAEQKAKVASLEKRLAALEAENKKLREKEAA